MPTSACATGQAPSTIVAPRHAARVADEPDRQPATRQPPPVAARHRLRAPTADPGAQQGPRPPIRTGTILDAVGNTPVLELSRLAAWANVPEGTRILGKAEFLNPGGSGKDRLAVALLRQAEANGLRPGGVVVEASSGNTGIALAQACALAGYRLHVVSSLKVSAEKVRLMEAYGATVHRAPSVPHGHPEHYLAKAQRLAREHRGAQVRHRT